MGYSMVQSKSDLHVLSCEVKIFECKAKLKDLSFLKDLKRVTTSLQKEIQEIKKAAEEDAKQEDKSKSSQLKSLLAFCKKLYELISKQRNADAKDEKIKKSRIKGEI